MPVGRIPVGRIPVGIIPVGGKIPVMPPVGGIIPVIPPVGLIMPVGNIIACGDTSPCKSEVLIFSLSCSFIIKIPPIL